jgi:hypothetical protein
MVVAADGAGGPEIPLSERRAALLQALSSVAVEVPVLALLLEAPLAHSHQDVGGKRVNASRLEWRVSRDQILEMEGNHIVSFSSTESVDRLQ